MRVSNRIVNLLYESSTKDDKIWKLIDKYEAGEMSKEEVEKEVKRLNKGNKAEIEADLALIFKESVEDNKIWIYSNAESEDRSDAESMIEAQYKSSFPNLKFSISKDSNGMYYVNFIGKYQDICDALINLGWYNEEEINSMVNNGLIKPYKMNEAVDEHLLSLVKKKKDLLTDDSIDDDTAYDIMEKIDNEMINTYDMADIEEAEKQVGLKESLTPAEQAEQRPDGSSEYRVRIENRGETVFEEYFSTEEEAIEYARNAVNSAEPGSIIEVLDPTISTVVQVSKKDNEDISYMGKSDAIINMLSDRYTKFNESTGDPAIDNDSDLNPEEVQSEVDYWTDVDNSRTEDVSGREPVGVYTVSNTQAIYVYDIKYDIDDMVLAGDSSDPNTAKWRFINYEDLIDEETGEAIPFFYYNAIKVPMNEVMRTNI